MKSQWPTQPWHPCFNLYKGEKRVIAKTELERRQLSVEDLKAPFVFQDGAEHYGSDYWTITRT